MRVGYVAGSKHTRNTRAGSIAFGHNVTRFVGGYPRLEDLGIRFVTNSQEETVDGYVVAFFVGSPIRFTTCMPSTPFSPNNPTALCSNNTVICG